MFKWPEHAPGGGITTPDGRKVVPFILAGWDYNDDATQLTLHLRKGLKWSDGVPLTTDDYMYWWEHVAFNADLTPTPPDKWSPVAMTNMEKIDDYTLKITFDKPNPRYQDQAFWVNMGLNTHFAPAHFMKQFNPDFTAKDKLEAEAKEAGFNTWSDLYADIEQNGPDHPEKPQFQRPVIRQYLVTERKPTYMMWERNPYWPFVDTKGNQLPYIDNIRVNIAANPQIAESKPATGDGDFGARFTETSQIPFFKSNEQKGNYKTFIYRRVYGSDIALEFNLTVADPDLRKLFDNPKFRQAVSLGINRKELNDKVNFGQAVEMQATVPPVSQYFDPEAAKAFAQYDLPTAKKMLDEIGMVDKDGDGWRDLPDGKTFNPTMVYGNFGPVDSTPYVELIKPMFTAMGLNINVKQINRALHDTMWPSNKGDMHMDQMDQLTDISFGKADKDLSPGGLDTGKDTPWPLWRQWAISNGEQGEEPPELLKKMIDWRTTLGTSADPAEREQAAKNLIKAQAENLWYIGLVTMAPQPVLVSNNLHNVPTSGLWDWTLGYMHAMYPMQFYLTK
jgi:peptide/nickel transport system substrate-binding protein